MTTSEYLTNSQKNVARLTDAELEAMGRRIREAREKKGVKQIELALQLAIGKNQMYRIESGQTPCKTEYLYEIAQVLDVSLDYLFFGNRDCKTITENDDAVQEIVSLCGGKDLETVHKALNILKAFFA
ncbi:MAG: helix-turn-helix transcriptional regulator [Lachnospiraceae bacterium]|nr:helix-turn-helix transcriptional regulator [Lachnospiraceae bacterium]